MGILFLSWNLYPVYLHIAIYIELNYNGSMNTRMNVDSEYFDSTLTLDPSFELASFSINPQIEIGDYSEYSTAFRCTPGVA